jgi:hypothetical protein
LIGAPVSLPLISGGQIYRADAAVSRHFPYETVCPVRTTRKAARSSSRPDATLRSEKREGDPPMSIKLLSSAVLAGILLSVSAPVVSYAANTPKTKAECEKAKDMKWDDSSSKCVKK